MWARSCDVVVGTFVCRGCGHVRVLWVGWVRSCVVDVGTFVCYGWVGTFVWARSCVVPVWQWTPNQICSLKPYNEAYTLYTNSVCKVDFRTWIFVKTSDLVCREIYTCNCTIDCQQFCDVLQPIWKHRIFAQVQCFHAFIVMKPRA
jgi:hypothetical protein